MIRKTGFHFSGSCSSVLPQSRSGTPDSHGRRRHEPFGCRLVSGCCVRDAGRCGRHALAQGWAVGGHNPRGQPSHEDAAMHRCGDRSGHAIAGIFLGRQLLQARCAEIGDRHDDRFGLHDRRQDHDLAHRRQRQLRQQLHHDHHQRGRFAAGRAHHHARGQMAWPLRGGSKARRHAHVERH